LGFFPQTSDNELSEISFIPILCMIQLLCKMRHLVIVKYLTITMG